MTWYQLALGIHALVAVLGIGQVLSLTFLAADVRAGGDRVPAALGLMRRISRVTSISLGLMLLSGIGLMIPTRGAYGSQWWFRIAFILFFVLGFFNGQFQRRIRVASGPASDASARALAGLPSTGWTMCGLVAVIVYLMAAKPF